MPKEKPVKVRTSRSGRELAEGTFSPLADIYETEAEVVLVADMPGVERDGITIQVDKGVLTLEAEGKVAVPDEKFSRTYVGFESGTYFRAFALSDEIDRDKITAAVADGVVTVHMPKASSAQSRKIEVKPSK